MEVGKVCLDSELEKYGGEVTLTAYLNVKDSRNIIKVSDPFSKKFLKSGQRSIMRKRLYIVITFSHRPYGIIHL